MAFSKSTAVAKDAASGLRKGKLKKQARQEAMRKEKERAAHLRLTLSKLDLLDEWSAFRRFERNGITASLESSHGAGLSEADVEECVALQRTNLAKVGDVGAWDEGAAADALRHHESRVILMWGAVVVPGPPPECTGDEWVVLSDTGEEAPTAPPPPPTAATLLGYLHLQFCPSEPQTGGQSMLCVLNMQLVPAVMGLGLGKFAMQLVELIARRDAMELVMLCVKDGKVTTMRLSKQKPTQQQLPLSIATDSTDDRHNAGITASHDDPADEEAADESEGEEDGFEVVSRPMHAAVQAMMAPAIKC